LVADDDHFVAAAGDRCTDVVGSGSRCEPLVGLGRDVEGARELAACLAGPEERARQNRIGSRFIGAEALTERPRLLAALGSQPPQLVRLSGLGLGMADEVQTHEE
jgi:hypothetical protein